MLLCLILCLDTTPPKAPDVQVICPTYPVYQFSDDQELSRELAALDPKKQAMVLRALGDYHAARLAGAACTPTPAGPRPPDAATETGSGRPAS